MPWGAYRYLEALIGVMWVMKKFHIYIKSMNNGQYCCKSDKCAHFYSFSKLGATLGTLEPRPAGQNHLLTLRYTSLGIFQNS